MYCLSLVKYTVQGEGELVEPIAYWRVCRVTTPNNGIFASCFKEVERMGGGVTLITVLKVIWNQHHIAYNFLRHLLEAQHGLSVIILLPLIAA